MTAPTPLPLDLESPAQAMHAALEAQRADFLRHVPVSYAVRHDRLERGLAMLAAHRKKLVEAGLQDFGERGPEWTLLQEVFGTVAAYQSALKNLKRWMRPERRSAPVPFNLFGATAQIQYQPLGVVGIMGAWNGPITLVLGPLAPVLAAGNRAMLCPSDLMPASAAAVAEAVREYFDVTEVTAVSGGLEVNKAFSALPFDHLMFTGSPGVGAKIMAAAAPNLVPVTLELGGKCPVVIGEDADMDDAAQRLAVTKTLNGGQACLSPDHFFVPRKRLDDFLQRIDAAMATLHPDPAANPNYCGMAIDRYYQRILDIIEDARQRGARVQTLGLRDGQALTNASARRIAVHAVIDAPADSRVMREELFGPLLAISTYDDVEDACLRIRLQPKPLGLYVFSRSARFRQFVLDRTFSGGVTLNDALYHYGVSSMPFGGVGRSGMGAYSYGIDGFRRFSHARGIYKQGGPRALLRVMRPPYGWMFDMAIRQPIEKIARKKLAAPRHPADPGGGTS